MKRHFWVCGLLAVLLSLLMLSLPAFSDPVARTSTLYLNDVHEALIAQLQTDFGTPGLAAASQPAACLPPEDFPLEQLPSVKLTLQPSRRQLPIGAPWSITGLLENQSAAPIYIVNRFTALTLPVEILGAKVAAVPATFPTTEGALVKSAQGYQVIRVFPQHTYPVVWHVEPLTSVYRITEILAPGVQHWLQLFPMLWSDVRHMLFFHPHPYQIAATVHYWKTDPQAYLDCLQPPALQVDVSTAPSVTTTMVVDLEASTWVILFGAWLGSITAYLFLVCMRKRPWSISGFLGACLLGPTVALFLKRLGEAAFVITINVHDFWGAIVIGYIAQYIGLQIIDHYVTRRPASDAPPAHPPPPSAPAGGTVDVPARRA